MKPIIAPSILASRLSCLKEEADRMVDCGCDWLHVDVMDGHFVPNISFGPPVIRSLRQELKSGEAVYLDVHLMTENPKRWVDCLTSGVANNITFHFECTEIGMDVEKSVELAKYIRGQGMRAGIAIKPKTPIEAVTDVLKSGFIDLLLVMTVEPGFGGQSFMHECMSKVIHARKAHPNLDIQVDGGIDENTIQDAAASGANVIVAGTSLYKSKNPKVLMEFMRDVVVSAM